MTSVLATKAATKTTITGDNGFGEVVRIKGPLARRLVDEHLFGGNGLFSRGRPAALSLNFLADNMGRLDRLPGLLKLLNTLNDV